MNSVTKAHFTKDCVDEGVQFIFSKQLNSLVEAVVHFRCRVMCECCKLGADINTYETSVSNIPSVFSFKYLFLCPLCCS